MLPKDESILTTLYNCAQLLNVDYKILAKRVDPVLLKLIHSDQKQVLLKED